MSEKRFVLYEHKGDYYILTSEEIVEKLNQLNNKVVELSE